MGWMTGLQHRNRLVIAIETVFSTYGTRLSLHSVMCAFLLEGSSATTMLNAREWHVFVLLCLLNFHFFVEPLFNHRILFRELNFQVIIM
jgi:hypothetical protein